MSWFCCSSRKKEKEFKHKVIPEKEVESKREELVRSIKVGTMTREEARMKRRVRGLENLGNSCYINAALQCLSHTNLFTEYLLTGEWRRHINPVNPMGTDGKLLAAYAKVILQLNEGKDKSAVHPDKFKDALDDVCSTVDLVD